MDKKKILSSLALAGILTAGVLGANVNATTAGEYLKPVGVYKKLVEGKTVVPYVLKDKNAPLTVNDIKAEFAELELVNGNAVTDTNATVKTGDTFVANGTEYTVVVYGDVNKDGKINTMDAFAIQNYVVGNAEIDTIQMEAADVNNNGKINTMDAFAIQNYVVGNVEDVIDQLPAIEDVTAPVITGLPEGGKMYINLNDSNFVLPQVTAIDDFDGEVNVVVTGEVNKTLEGDYIVTYTATDRAGNTATANLTVTVDGKAPVLSGVVDGQKFYIKLNDTEFVLPEATATDTVDGEVEVTVEGIVNKEVEGSYDIVYTAKDSMENETKATITVVVDGKAPVADVRYSTTVLTKDGVVVTVVSDEEIKAPEGWELSEDGMSMSKKYMENVEDELLMVSDLAGNETETHIRITNIDTKVVAAVNYDVTEPTNGVVIATISADEKLQAVEGWTLAKDGMSMTKEYSKNVITDVVVKDMLGNETTVNVNIQNIDKVAPTAEVQFDVTIMTNGNVKVTILANEELKAVEGMSNWELDSEDAKKASAIFEANTTEEGEQVTITDLAGNTSVVPVRVSNIDKDAPVLEVSYDETASTNKNVIATITSNEKVQAVEGWTLAENGMSMTKEYEANISEDVVVTDLVGNNSTATITITNIDKDAPVVEGFTEGKSSYQAVTPTFVEGVATLQKEGEESQSYTSGTEISVDGKYVLTVRDAAGNETVVNFIIDNAAPVFDTLEDVTLKNGDEFDTKVIAKDAVDGNIEATLVITFNGEEVESIDATGENDGEYTLTYTAVDEAGNSAEATRKVIVDATAAKLVSLQSSNSDATTEVTIRVEFNEKMQVLEGWVAESDEQLAFTKKYEANTSETVEFKDIAGNITKVEIAINNIDSDAPLAVVSYSITEPTQGPVIATITAGEELKAVDGWTLSEDRKSMTKKYTQNTELEGEEVTISDLAGNEAKVTIKVLNIDVVAPEGDVTYSETENTKNNVVATITAEEELKEVAGWKLSADKKSMTKTYTKNTSANGEEVTISDLAGNTDTVTVVVTNIDREAPVVEGLTEGISSYKKLDLTFTDNTAPITLILQKGTEEATTEELASGDTKTIDVEGEYKLIAKDALGNEVEILFNIDQNATTITGVENGKRYKEAKPLFPEGVAVLNKLDTDKQTILSTEAFTSGTVIKADGNYEVVVTDAAGNEDRVSFEIDTKAPEVTNIENGKTYTAPITPVVEEAGTVEVIKLVKDGEEVEEYNLTEIAEDGSYELTLEDDLGNSKTIRFVIDQTGPQVTGVENGGEYKTAIPAFTEGTAKLQKAGEEAIDFTSGTEISADGEYTLVVTDKHGNATTITFTVDNVGPVLTGVEEKTYIAGESVIPASTETELKVSLVKDGETVKDYTALAEITTGDGEYTLTVADKAGNKTVVEFTIDTVVENVKVVTSNKGNATNENVIATITSKEAMKPVDGWTLSEDKMSMTKVYDANATEEVTITDLVGNTETIEVVVEGIDKVNPTASVEYDITEATKGPVTVTITASEQIQKVEGWKLADDGITLTKEFTDNVTEETVTIVDLAGNVIEAPVKVSIDNIYNGVPTISGMLENSDVKVSLTDKIALPTVIAKDVKGAEVEVTTSIKQVIDGTEVDYTGTELVLSSVTKYVITYTATDVAGNVATVERVINVVSEVAE